MDLPPAQGRASIPLDGDCTAAFAALRDELAACFEARELGGALAVVHRGRLVVDLWGGFADRAGTRPWTRDTLACAFSATKGVTALCMLQALDEGAFELDAPVARYWPAFGRAAGSGTGQEAVTVRHCLSHRAGLPGFAEPVALQTFYDRAAMAERLAAERPWWPPGARHGYHVRTFGLLANELLARTTGLTVGQWLQERVARPCGLDFHIGLGAHERARCAEVAPARVRAGETLPGGAAELLRAMNEPDTATAAAFGNPQLGREYNTERFRAAELPGMNGHGDARSLAWIYGALAGDRRLAGQELLSAPTLAQACSEQAASPDEVLRVRTRFGLGFMLADADTPLGRGRSAFGHPGAGGSLAFADPERELGFAWVMNRMEPGIVAGGRSARRLAEVVCACVDGAA